MGGAPNAEIRVAIADDHALIRLALERLFADAPDLHVVGSVCDGLAAVDLVERHAPDVLILDQQMPSLDGLGVMQRLCDAGSTTKIVFLVGALTDHELVRAIQLGVRGLLWKAEAFEVIVDCVRSVHQGRICIGSDDILRAFEIRSRHHRIGATMTPREREIAELVCDGLRNRDIAARLHLTEGTVKVHLHNIYSKLGVDDRVSLLRVVSSALV